MGLSGRGLFQRECGVLRVGEFQGTFSFRVEDIKRNSDQGTTFLGYLLKIKNTPLTWHFVD